jgi:hypothetical protein
MAYVGHDDPQYLYAEYVAAALEAQQAHREYCESSWARTEETRRYWWAAQRCAYDYRGKLRYGLDGKPRDLSSVDQWRQRVPQGD